MFTQQRNFFPFIFWRQEIYPSEIYFQRKPKHRPSVLCIKTKSYKIQTNWSFKGYLQYQPEAHTGGFRQVCTDAAGTADHSAGSREGRRHSESPQRQTADRRKGFSPLRRAGGRALLLLMVRGAPSNGGFQPYRSPCSCFFVTNQDILSRII